MSALTLVSAVSADTLGFANNLYNTGVDSTGIVLTPDQQDTHYTVQSYTPDPIYSGATYTGPIYTGGGGMAGSPVSPDNTAIEITPSATATDYPAGLYVYQLHLTNLVAGSTVTISGDVAGDDSVTTISIDGFLAAVPVTSVYTDFVPFTLTFTAGASNTNNLDFTVNNTHGYTGLLVDNISGTTSAPEPSTWALLCGGLGALGWLILRRNRLAL